MKEHRLQTRLMGSDFEFIVVTPSDTDDGLLEVCVAEVKRIEILLTEFSTTSVTAQINQAAGKPAIAVPEEVYQLIHRCKTLSALTQGAFDITAGVIKRLYNFKGGDFIWPDRDTLQQKLGCSGYDKIHLTPPNQVRLEKEGMHIAFGAVGKGYAADCVKALLVKRGVASGVINASGDLTAWGKRADGSPWKIGIADPDQPSRTILWLPVDGGSVATSGDYEQYVMRDGIRYSHTVDPKTGLPVHGIKSVTIVSASAELSDALATAVFVMGIDVGLHFLEQLPLVHGLIVNDQNKIFTSRHLKIQHHEPAPG
jgi:thiamine biosynthesis lipoprotein